MDLVVAGMAGGVKGRTSGSQHGSQVNLSTAQRTIFCLLEVLLSNYDAVVIVEVQHMTCGDTRKEEENTKDKYRCVCSIKSKTKRDFI